ncbi:MAG TPA: hypothetical protein VFT74_21855 [Isosphaeraceae bacterium]|nr:hypothetical protein [Isosphaeraceae bacterium]
MAIGACRQSDEDPEGPGYNRGWKVLLRATRLLADHFNSRSAQMCGTPLPLTREAALAEVEAHQDSIVSTLTKPDPGRDENPTRYSGPFSTLLDAADRAHVIGVQRQLLLAVISKGGRISIADASVDCLGDALSAYKRLKRKKLPGWRVIRSGGDIWIERSPVRGRK